MHLGAVRTFLEQHSRLDDGSLDVCCGDKR